jgi:hypothetical protein
MAKGSKKIVVIAPNVDTTTVALMLHGQVASEKGLEVAGKLNAVVAYWNTALERNVPPNESTKITAATGNIKAGTGSGTVRSLSDMPNDSEC